MWARQTCCQIQHPTKWGLLCCHDSSLRKHGNGSPGGAFSSVNDLIAWSTGHSLMTRLAAEAGALSSRTSRGQVRGHGGQSWEGHRRSRLRACLFTDEDTETRSEQCTSISGQASSRVQWFIHQTFMEPVLHWALLGTGDQSMKKTTDSTPASKISLSSEAWHGPQGIKMGMGITDY